MNYEVTPSENLSNGDTVTLSVEISDYFQKEYKVTAKAASKEITVSGLQEPEMVDPFDDSIFTTIFSENPEEGKVSFEIIGTIPELRLNLINDAPEDSPLKNLQYYVDDFDTYKEYSEDDTIALHVKPKAPQDFAKNMHSPATRLRFPLREHPNIFAPWTK